MTVPAPSGVRREAVTASGFAFVAGFVDTVGFVALFGLFTAHVTGNFVVIGASLVEPRSGLITKLLALPVFVATVALAHLILSARARAGRRNAVFAIFMQTILLAAFMAAGFAAAPIEHGDHPLAMLAGLLGVAAMGVQNAAGRTAFKAMTPTTVMTGNTTQLVMDAVDLLRGERSEGTRVRFRKTWPVVIAFAAGAVLGALGIRASGFWCLTAPIVVLGGLMMAVGKPDGG